jgi:putative CocE/NonD family hydrolase
MTNAPCIHVAGWYDILLQGNIDAFVGMQYHGGKNALGKQKLIIGPFSHGAIDKVGEFTFPHATDHNPYVEWFDWYDECLKGPGPEASKLKAVTYYTMGAMGEAGAPGNEWRSSDVWPIKAQDTPYYLHRSGSLNMVEPAEESSSRSYNFDPNNPVPTLGGQNLVAPAGPFDQSKIENRPDVLLFTSGALKKPLEVTGRVKVKLWASSSAPDTDFTAKLTDVYPDGRSMLICDGIIRARYRNSFEDPVLMQPGKVYKFEIDLWSTSMIFNKGHRIRLAISSSNSPRFDVNPNTGEQIFTETEKVTAKNTIYFDAEHPSAIMFPVVGR